MSISRKFRWKNFSLTAENIYFSDHDAMRLVTEKNYVDFHTNPWNPKWPGKKEEFTVFLGSSEIFNLFGSVVDVVIEKDRQCGTFC